MKNKFLTFIAIGAMAISLAACGSSSETAATDAAAEDTAEQASSEVMVETEEKEAAPDGMYYSELTNELISTDLEDQRPIAAMVDNESIALPHYGLSQADIIYEMMNSTQNGRITRFMAIFKDYDSVEQIGSIRSVRPTNVIISAEYNAILCHDGGPFYIDEYLAEPCTDNFSGIFSRVNNGKSREYTEYILTGDVDSAIENSSVSKTYNEYANEGQHFNFANSEYSLSSVYDDTESAANDIDLPFPHNGSYLEYNADDGLYYYSEYGEAHVDPEYDNAQLCFKNCLILSMGYTQLDEHGYLIYDCYNTSGYGYYVTNGESEYIKWEKGDMTDITKYYDMDGNEIKLNTGKTYIAFVPVDSWDDLVIE